MIVPFQTLRCGRSNLPQIFTHLALVTIVACIGNLYFVIFTDNDYGYNFYHQTYDFPRKTVHTVEMAVLCMWACAAASVFHFAKSGKLAKWVEADHNRSIAATETTDEEPIVVVIR